ncbi:Similar to DNAH2: Dynein heavy chain 2 [Cotesia congregata]|uniref:Axonemal (Homo sapiens) n=1 Tax=Cotesia congregata TaxID=51543 RepID=A0A8J2ELF5_COTCN|nr:Similar to DNAH2: Dynein heavy chain 2 [Cotesia congregata]
MSLYGFLSSLTEQRYKAGGLTVIYVPIETNNLTVTEACSNKELMDRLEKLIFLWTKQIRLALSESESQIINARFTCIIDEHKFWTTRWTNLRGLNHQIKSAQVQHILSILSQANSGQLEQFVLLNNEIELRTKEAETNIEFLELLKAPCEDLNEITKPEDLLELLPKVLHVFRYIWLNSTFYGERAYHLMKMINNQVINLNRGFVNLDDIFEHKKTREGIEILEKCIGACENYKDLYSKAILIINLLARSCAIRYKQSLSLK